MRPTLTIVASSPLPPPRSCARRPPHAHVGRGPLAGDPDAPRARPHAEGAAPRDAGGTGRAGADARRRHHYQVEEAGGRCASPSAPRLRRRGTCPCSGSRCSRPPRRRSRKRRRRHRTQRPPLRARATRRMPTAGAGPPPAHAVEALYVNALSTYQSPAAAEGRRFEAPAAHGRPGDVSRPGRLAPTTRSASGAVRASRASARPSHLANASLDVPIGPRLTLHGSEHFARGTLENARGGPGRRVLLPAWDASRGTS